MKKTLFIIYAILLLFLIRCTKYTDFKIAAAPENKILEPILKQFSKNYNVTFKISYMKSIEIMKEIKNKDTKFDIVWPASKIWITLGDIHKQVTLLKSIMTSPVVYSFTLNKARMLGLKQKQITSKQIIQSIRLRQFSYIMASASQSNSAAGAYLGLLAALTKEKGKENIITKKIKYQLSSMLRANRRLSGDSKWLKEIFLKGSYDAMVNYEAVIIEINKKLIKAEKDPLFIAYPADGLFISDFPMGYLKKPNNQPKKIILFKKLQKYLHSKKVQVYINSKGFRNRKGSQNAQLPKKIFNTKWGINTNKKLESIKIPDLKTIKNALHIYQTELRKPSFTIFCLDYSGSMSDNGSVQLKKAMDIMLDQKKANKHILNFTKYDRTIIIPFAHDIKHTWRIFGNSRKTLNNLNRKIQSLSASGATNIYLPIIAGLKEMKWIDINRYHTAIIIMTDGTSTSGTFESLKKQWEKLKKDAPVFCIQYGSAKKLQLTEISDLTKGKVFDGRKNLVKTFLKVKGYN